MLGLLKMAQKLQTKALANNMRLSVDVRTDALGSVYIPLTAGEKVYLHTAFYQFRSVEENKNELSKIIEFLGL